MLPVAAAPPDKQECIDAHTRGQELRDKNALVEARNAFVLCAQASCPSVVQADCAQLASEMTKLVPSVSFAARDAAGHDLPRTTVLVDGTPLTTHLDDGKSHELNPGRHQVRFVHEGAEVSLDLVVTQGEKGRAVVGTFPAPAPRATASASEPAASVAPVVAPGPVTTGSRSAVPLVVTGLGATALVAGVVLTLVGHGQIPSACDLGSHRCRAPAGDGAFDEARRGVTTMNVGFVVGGVGAATVAGGLIWYLTQSTEPATATALAPWSDGRSGGLLYRGRF